jgi:hypothetical protein
MSWLALDLRRVAIRNYARQYSIYSRTFFQITPRVTQKCYQTSVNRYVVTLSHTRPASLRIKNVYAMCLLAEVEDPWKQKIPVVIMSFTLDA